VSDADRLAEAVAELYSADPDEFIERRDALAGQAREAGDAKSAKMISGLRKPTRSAWVLNLLVRSAPEAVSRLDSLGRELRAAQRSLDGAALRELSSRRRQLIDDLARQAFAGAGLHAPPAALRDEVTATLGAALADPEVSQQLAEGTLVRAARREGFSPAAAPLLRLVPPLPSGQREPAAKRASPARTRAASGAPARPGPATRRARPAPAAADAAVVAAARARAERERHRQAIAVAEQALAAADRAALAAAAAEHEQETTVRRIQDQLADAQQRLADAQQLLAEARLQARQAATEQRRASQALDRLRDEPPPAAPSPIRPLD
jgi:hypothetical protein